MKNPFTKFQPSKEEPERGELPDRELYWNLSAVELQIEVWSKITNTMVAEDNIKINTIVAFNNNVIVEGQLQHIINSASHTYLQERENRKDDEDHEHRVIGAVILNLMHLGVMTPDQFTKRRGMSFGIMAENINKNGETSH